MDPFLLRLAARCAIAFFFPQALLLILQGLTTAPSLAAIFPHRSLAARLPCPSPRSPRLFRSLSLQLHMPSSTHYTIAFFPLELYCSPRGYCRS